MTIRASATLLAAGAVAAGIAFAGVAPARACSTEDFIGTVCVTAATYCPSGYLEANGQTLQISQYQVVYALLGTTYGGNGTSTFNLPDLRGRTPVGRNPTPNPSTGVVNTVALGQARGAESYAMTGVFGHTHAAVFTPGSGSLTVNIPVSSNSGTTQVLPDATHNYLAASLPGGVTAAAIWSDTLAQLTTVGGVTVSGGAGGTVDVASTGSAQTVPTLPPQLGLLHCVAMQGNWPPRD